MSTLNPEPKSKPLKENTACTNELPHHPKQHIQGFEFTQNNYLRVCTEKRKRCHVLMRSIVPVRKTPCRRKHEIIDLGHWACPATRSLFEKHDGVINPNCFPGPLQNKRTLAPSGQASKNRYKGQHQAEIGGRAPHWYFHSSVVLSSECSRPTGRRS